MFILVSQSQHPQAQTPVSQQSAQVPPNSINPNVPSSIPTQTSSLPSASASNTTKGGSNVPGSDCGQFIITICE